MADVTIQDKHGNKIKLSMIRAMQAKQGVIHPLHAAAVLDAFEAMTAIPEAGGAYDDGTLDAAVERYIDDGRNDMRESMRKAAGIIEGAQP